MGGCIIRPPPLGTPVGQTSTDIHIAHPLRPTPQTNPNPGGMAGVAGWMAVMPMDMAKSIIQTSPNPKGLVPTMLDVVRSRGPFALYSGAWYLASRHSVCVCVSVLPTMYISDWMPPPANPKQNRRTPSRPDLSLSYPSPHACNNHQIYRAGRGRRAGLPGQRGALFGVRIGSGNPRLIEVLCCVLLRGMGGQGDDGFGAHWTD